MFDYLQKAKVVPKIIAPPAMISRLGLIVETSRLYLLVGGKHDPLIDSVSGSSRTQVIGCLQGTEKHEGNEQQSRCLHLSCQVLSSQNGQMAFHLQNLLPIHVVIILFVRLSAIKILRSMIVPT